MTEFKVGDRVKHRSDYGTVTDEHTGVQVTVRLDDGLTVVLPARELEKLHAAPPNPSSYDSDITAQMEGGEVKFYNGDGEEVNFYPVAQMGWYADRFLKSNKFRTDVVKAMNQVASNVEHVDSDEYVVTILGRIVREHAALEEHLDDVYEDLGAQYYRAEKLEADNEALAWENENYRIESDQFRLYNNHLLAENRDWEGVAECARERAEKAEAERDSFGIDLDTVTYARDAAIQRAEKAENKLSRMTANRDEWKAHAEKVQSTLLVFDAANPGNDVVKADFWEDSYWRLWDKYQTSEELRLQAERRAASWWEAAKAFARDANDENYERRQVFDELFTLKKALRTLGEDR